MPGLNLGLPRSVGSGSLPTPVAGKASYVDGQLNPALSAGFGPQTLIDNLPATLQPGSTLFYYNPEEENPLLQQASLKETGKASFIDGLAYDSKQNLSPTQIEKAVLYQNALEYAKTNGLQLGAALTQTQVTELDKPMLWYVEQTVPDPRCTATGVGVCPTITALMPQIYLPSDTSAMSAGGNIQGQNVTLNFNQDGNGSILNTGSISAGGTLSVDTNTLTNQANVVDVGEIWNKVSGGYTKVTGTQVQPGGFMSAADMDLNVQTLSGIGGMLQKLNGDGTIDQAGTQQLLADLQQRLGGNFTQVEVKDNLHTDFVKEGGSFGVIQLVAIVAAVAMSFVLGPEMLAAFDALIDPIALAAISPGLMEFASVASYALAAGSTAFVANGASQLISTGSFDLGAGLKGAAVSALTAGLTQGLVGNSGINTVGVVTEADPATTLANLGNTAVKIGERGLIGAGVNAAINGGSFGQAWLNSVGNDFAAVGANGIGSSELFGSGPLNVLAHAALGCAAQSLSGGDCAGGAVGGAASAIAAPLIRDAIYDGSQTVVENADGTRTTQYNDRGSNAAIAALATLVGGSAGALLGTNATSAASAAQNEVLNNALSAKLISEKSARLVDCGGNTMCESAVTAEFRLKSNAQTADFVQKVSDPNQHTLLALNLQNDQAQVQELLANPECQGVCRDSAQASLVEYGRQIAMVNDSPGRDLNRAMLGTAVDAGLAVASGVGLLTRILRGGAAAADVTASADSALNLAETQATLAQQVGDLRATLTGNAKTGGNMGVAQIDIPGIQPTMAASSRIANPTPGQQALGFVGQVPEVFPSSVVPLPNGFPLLREVDSEAKILNNVATQLGNNTSATGTINLLTERAPCASCSNVIQQFQAKYPNIKVNVLDNGGVIPPTRKGP